MSDCKLCEDLLRLFGQYRESLGMPDTEDCDRACEYEVKVLDVICKHRGHTFYPDHCNRPEHDFCGTCHGRADALGYERDGQGGHRKKEGDHE